MISQTEIKARAWDALMDYFRRNGVMLSLRESRRIVGGKVKLDTLLADGKVVEAQHEVTAANSKRWFPAAQIYEHIKGR